MKDTFGMKFHEAVETCKKSRIISCTIIKEVMQRSMFMCRMIDYNIGTTAVFNV